MRHGTIGGYDRLTLYFFEWPDLGTYFLFHGVGWGNSWPIALLAMVAIVVAWRRRGTEPRPLMVAAAAVVWYVVAEATPLKRGGDIERYVLPCAPLLAALGGGVGRTRRRRDRSRSGSSVAPDLSERGDSQRFAGRARPPPHPAACARLLLTAGIEDDTRRQAARWLERRGPKPPYELAYVGDAASTTSTAPRSAT